MNVTTVPVLLSFSIAAAGTLEASVLAAQDAASPAPGEARIQGWVVHDEDSTPVRRFRIYLRGEGMAGDSVDGWEYPGMKRGWTCTPFGPRSKEEEEEEEEDEAETAPLDSRLAEARERATGPKAYRFDRAVVGGEGRFEWVIEAHGRDPAHGYVELRKGRATDLGEARLRAGSAVIQGFVVDARGDPVAGARVQLTGRVRLRPGRNWWVDRIRTDGRGFYRFDRVPAGKGFVHVVPGPVPAMPPLPVTFSPANIGWADFRPKVGTLAVRVDVPAGSGWTRPFELRLESPKGGMAVWWPVFPPKPEPGMRQFFGMSSGVGCSHLSESIKLRAVPPGRPPAWEAGPPQVSGKGSPEEVEVEPSGSSFRIANVPLGEWEVSLVSAQRRIPPAELALGLQDGDGWERWVVPRLRPSPNTVEVRAGETTPLVLRPE